MPSSVSNNFSPQSISAQDIAAVRNRPAAAAMKSKLAFGVGLAALVAVIVAGFLWSSQPDFRVLFANVSDKDGGAIVAQLSQMAIPYRFSDGGNAILVPADKVHEARLKLASQGLPQGGNIGFEILENQKFGMTQFQEQVSYQRALEGELAKSIQSLSAVQGARVHLALPKQTVFMRDQQKPTASVLLNLYPGRSLDRSQVSGIIHLVSASVPELSLKQVSILDQHGNLLSGGGESSAASNLDPTQISYLREMEESLSRRIADLIEPIVGRSGVRAQVTADIDFTQVESTAETYAPNQGPDTKASVRSQTTSEAGGTGAGPASGVPGALSNTPAAAPTAPINNPAPGASATVSNNRREAVTNYEVDRTIRKTRNQSGVIKRINAAVLVNHKRNIDADGKAVFVALTEAEIKQIQTLVQEAIGFNKERGDVVEVVNAPFAMEAAVESAETPWWKDGSNIALAKEGGKALGLFSMLLIVVFAVIRPALRALTSAKAAETTAVPLLTAENEAGAPLQLPGPAANLEQIRDIAKNDPAMVASVVRQWVGRNG